MEKPSYYAMIPANVRYDDNLSFLERLLYAEITSLTSKEGYCWASNTYFAKLFNKHERSISRSINNLIKAGYLKSFIDKVSGNKRKLWIGIHSTNINDVETIKDITTDNSVNSCSQDCEEVYTETSTGINNSVNSYAQKQLQINKSINKNNNKNNNIVVEQIIDEKISDENLKNILLDFIDHRKTKKKPMTQKSVELLIKNLDKLSSDIKNKNAYKIAMLEEAILHSWDTVYALKDFDDFKDDFPTSNNKIDIKPLTLDDIKNKSIEELLL